MVYALGMKTILKKYGRVLAFVAVVLALGTAWLYAADERNDAKREEQRMRLSEAEANNKASLARSLRASESFQKKK